jgi:hypothetical protein
VSECTSRSALHAVHDFPTPRLELGEQAKPLDHMLRRSHPATAESPVALSASTPRNISETAIPIAITNIRSNAIAPPTISDTRSFQEMCVFVSATAHLRHFQQNALNQFFADSLWNGGCPGKKISRRRNHQGPEAGAAGPSFCRGSLPLTEELPASTHAASGDARTDAAQPVSGGISFAASAAVARAATLLRRQGNGRSRRRRPSSNSPSLHIVD